MQNGKEKLVDESGFVSKEIKKEAMKKLEQMQRPYWQAFAAFAERLKSRLKSEIRLHKGKTEVKVGPDYWADVTFSFVEPRLFGLFGRTIFEGVITTDPGKKEIVLEIKKSNSALDNKEYAWFLEEIQKFSPVLRKFKLRIQ